MGRDETRPAEVEPSLDDIRGQSEGNGYKRIEAGRGRLALTSRGLARPLRHKISREGSMTSVSRRSQFKHLVR